MAGLCSARLAWAGGLLLALGLPWPLAAQQAPAPWHSRLLAGAQGQALWALERPAPYPPLRYRVVVIPGSGCSGMAALAPSYFAGLLHAQLLVLHKPQVQPGDGHAPAHCSPRFVQQDALSAWQAHALAALQSLPQEASPRLPTVLVGISEGAEILPALAAALPEVAGLVLLSGSGLDPREAGALQAERLGQLPAWQALERAQASGQPDTAVVQGRSLRYWRDLWQWPLAQPLIQGPWPLLQVWGDRDALVPAQAYLRFAAQAQQRSAPFCSWRLPGADHGLQSAAVDGVQQLWARLERWARQPDLGLCTAVP